MWRVYLFELIAIVFISILWVMLIDNDIKKKK